MILLGATTWASLLADVEWDLKLTTLTLVGALLVGAVLVALTARWRRRTRSAELTASDQLAEFRSLYLEGAISKEEFDQLRAVLGGEMRRELDVPAPKPTAVTPQAPSPGAAPPTPAAEEKPQTPEPPAEGVQPG
jgi:hypothetical protein